MTVRKSPSQAAGGIIAVTICGIALAAHCSLAKSSGLSGGRVARILLCVCMIAILLVQIAGSLSEVVLDDHGVRMRSGRRGEKSIAWENCGTIGAYKVWFFGFIEYLVFAEEPCKCFTRRDWRGYIRHHRDKVILIERRDETVSSMAVYAPTHLISRYEACPTTLMRAPVSVEVGVLGIILMAAGVGFFLFIALRVDNLPGGFMVLLAGCAVLCMVLCVITVENSSEVTIDGAGIHLWSKLYGPRHILWENCGAIGGYGFYYGYIWMLVFAEERCTFSSHVECRRYSVRHRRSVIQVQVTDRVMEKVEKYAPAQLVNECKRLIP